MFNQILIKNYLSTLILSIATFFVPISHLLLLVGVFIFADTALGMYKSYKKNDTITSRKFSNIVSKMFLYQGAIILAYMLDAFLLGEFSKLFIDIELLITKLTTLVIIFTEIKSLDENFKIVTGIHLWQVFKKMLRRAEEVKTDIKKLKK